jgi:hypothetical protein
MLCLCRTAPCLSVSVTVHVFCLHLLHVFSAPLCRTAPCLLFLCDRLCSVSQDCSMPLLHALSDCSMPLRITYVLPSCTPALCTAHAFALHCPCLCTLGRQPPGRGV